MCLEARRLRLSRANRLRESRAFAELRQEGLREARGCLVANWKLAPGQAVSRLGVIASRRIGSAVVRNRAKRLLREVFRRRQHELITPVDLVLVARSSIVGCACSQVEKDWVGLLRRARMLRET
jgi:ribonuclease P protein component